MPTFCEILGENDFPTKYQNPRLETDYFDGISFLPELKGEGKQVKHDYLYWEFEETDQIGVRMNNWKLVVKKGTPLLYDLSVDLHEDNDISAEHLDIVKKMCDIIHDQHIESPDFKVTLPE